MKTLRDALLLMAGLVAAGCGFLGITGDTCLTSQDCPDGFRCNASYLCEEIPAAEDVVHFELRPPSDSGTTKTQASLDLSDRRVDSLDLQLELDTATTLQGSVPSPFAAGGVAGSVTASLEPAAFGARGLTWSASVPADGRFELSLAPSGQGSYQLLFRPGNREEFPQLRYERAEAVAGETNVLDMVYPAYPTPEQLEGQDPILLVKVQVLESELAPFPVGGMVVEGVSDQGLRTSLATPDAQGIAYLRLPAVRRFAGGAWTWQPATGLELIIRPSTEGMRLPTVSYPGVALTQPDLGTFHVGELPGSHAISGRVVTVRGVAVASCQLHFLLAELGQGSLKYVLETDAEGAFATTLPAGSYQVRAIPPLASEAAITTSSLELHADEGNWLVEVEERLRLTGLVRDHQGDLLPDLAVVASRLSDWSGLDDGALRSYDGRTGADGSLSLLLDPGQYDLALLPDEASGLPYHTLRTLFLTADLALTEEQSQLPAPSQVRGHAFNAVGEPQCGVVIEAFREDERGLLSVGQTVSGDSSTTGCNGAFSLVLPTRPAP